MLTACSLVRSAPEQVILVRSSEIVATVFAGVFPSPPFCSHQVKLSPTWIESFLYVWLLSVCKSSFTAVFWLTSTAEARAATRNHPSLVTLISRLNVPLVEKAEDGKTVPVPPTGAAPSVPVSKEASRIVAVGSGLTVMVSAARLEMRPALSLMTYDACALPLKPAVGV